MLSCCLVKFLSYWWKSGLIKPGNVFLKSVISLSPPRFSAFQYWLQFSTWRWRLHGLKILLLLLFYFHAFYMDQCLLCSWLENYYGFINLLVIYEFWVCTSCSLFFLYVGHIFPFFNWHKCCSSLLSVSGDPSKMTEYLQWWQIAHWPSSLLN